MGQVEQMHALVDELAATRARRVGSPLAVVAEASSVTVASRGDASDRRASPEWTSSAARAIPGWKRWLNPTLTRRPLVRSALDQTIYLRGRDSCGLLDEHVRAGLQRALGDCGELVMNGRDDDHVGPVASMSSSVLLAAPPCCSESLSRLAGSTS